MTSARSLARAIGRGEPLRLALAAARRPLSTTGGDKPAWQVAAENEARAQVGDASRFAKGLASEERLSNVLMDKVLHEFKGEGVSNTKKMEEKLENQIKQLNALLETVEDEDQPVIVRNEAAASFKALRVKADLTKQEVLIQREAVFGTQDEKLMNQRFELPHLPL